LGNGVPKITLKELFEAAKYERPMPIIGIECGNHENLADVVPRATGFLNALLFNMGFSRVKPHGWDEDKGEFYKYHVEGRLPLHFLEGGIIKGDRIYPVKACKTPAEAPAQSDRVIAVWPSGSAEIVAFRTPEGEKKIKALPPGTKYYAI